jgi:hypothetical protein
VYSPKSSIQPSCPSSIASAATEANAARPDSVVKSNSATSNELAALYRKV